MMIKKGNESEFCKQIINLYSGRAFGSLSKSDIDAFMMDALLTKSDLLDIPFENYWNITDAQIREISAKLLITERKTKSLIDSAFARFGRAQDAVNIQQIFKKMLEKTGAIDPHDVFQGKIRIHVPNNILRSELEHHIISKSSFPDYSFNRNILTLTINQVLKILEADEEKVKERFLEEIEKAASNGQVKKKIEKIQEKRKSKLEDILKSIGTAIGSKMIADSGNVVIKILFGAMGVNLPL